jgi:hypothetical protein
MRIRTAVALSALMLAGGIGTASAQTVIVEESYGIVGAPVYAPPVFVAPAPRVYLRTAPVYVAPPVPRYRYSREVIVRESLPGWSPGGFYSDW